MKLIKSFHIYGLFQMMMGKRLLLVFMAIAFVQTVFANGENGPDFMRSIGKIYVVASVCFLILVTLLVYMVLLDRKISRLEKRQNNE